jgi:hypothetical protein
MTHKHQEGDIHSNSFSIPSPDMLDMEDMTDEEKEALLHMLKLFMEDE